MRMMQMLKFGDFFLDLAARQMVLFWIDLPRKQLPVTAYGLLEYYCGDPSLRLPAGDVECRFQGYPRAGFCFDPFWLGAGRLLQEMG
ncbi:MAG: hypothetical protein L0Z50_39210 [Verrucomicrobiales bacterium]|nr:hypothetical protein [Verrucomicrobiales bacterium]